MKFLTPIDISKNELQNARIQNLATAPAEPVEGQLYYNSTDKTVYVYANGAWRDALYNYTGELFTGAYKTKLDGIATGATKVEASAANGNIKVNGAETKVYAHPGSGTNPHGTTKSDVGLGNVPNVSTNDQTPTYTAATTLAALSSGEKLSAAFGKLAKAVSDLISHLANMSNPHGVTKSQVGLGSVENKSAATILNELTAAKIVEKLGFTPKEIKVGKDADKGTASGSQIVYIATDTKKIWLDNADGAWLQVGGQDTISWSNVTGKPSTFTPPVATESRLGGIKVGANLSITPDGVLSANDNPTSYIVKQQRFVATANQTSYTLTGGSYRTGIGALSVYINGAKQSAGVITEASATSFKLPSGLPEGTVVLAEYIQLIDVDPYPIHAAEHLANGADPIPVATTTASGLESAADKAKLDGIATGATKVEASAANGNIKVNGAETKVYAHPGSGTNPHGTTKSDVGLGNVPNVSTNDQTPTYTAATTLAALSSGEKLSAAFGKLAKAVSDLISHLSNKSNPHGVTKSQVGLGNVTNTADADKPVSTAQQAALNKKMDLSLKGAAGGVAELDADGKVPAAQLPSYVDDVLEYNALAEFPETGETGKIYVAKDNNKTYRWSGTAYVEISASLALGETASTAYRGDRGKIAYDHSQVTSGNPHGTTKSHVGLGNVPNVATNDQTPSYTAATTLAALSSGEKLSVAFGKLSKAVSDLISHLADGTKHITTAERTSWNSRTKKYAANVGTGSATEITVTHGLGTQDITVMVRETASPYNQVYCDVQVISTTQIKLLFASAPASGAYRVIVTG